MLLNIIIAAAPFDGMHDPEDFVHVFRVEAAALFTANDNFLELFDQLRRFKQKHLQHWFPIHIISRHNSPPYALLIPVKYWKEDTG